MGTGMNIGIKRAKPASSQMKARYIRNPRKVEKKPPPPSVRRWLIAVRKSLVIGLEVVMVLSSGSSGLVVSLSRWM